MPRPAIGLAQLSFTRGMPGESQRRYEQAAELAADDLAGGVDALWNPFEPAEDSAESGHREMASRRPGPQDVVAGATVIATAGQEFATRLGIAVANAPAEPAMEVDMSRHSSGLLAEAISSRNGARRARDSNTTYRPLSLTTPCRLTVRPSAVNQS